MPEKKRFEAFVAAVQAMYELCEHIDRAGLSVDDLRKIAAHAVEYGGVSTPLCLLNMRDAIDEAVRKSPEYRPCHSGAANPSESSRPALSDAAAQS